MLFSWKENSKNVWGQDEEVTDEGTLQGSEHEVQNSPRTLQGLFAHFINRTISSPKKQQFLSTFNFLSKILPYHIPSVTAP